MYKFEKKKMRKIVLSIVFVLIFFIENAQTVTPVTYEYKLFTTVESVISGGFGRSRLIATDKSTQMVEKDLENFFSLVGINFKNIQNNDQIITSKINEYAKDGYELFQVAPGVYSGTENKGIFLTRYIFRKEIGK